MKPWRVLSSEVLLDRLWLRLRQEQIQLPDGVVVDEFHVIESPDWVGMLVLTRDSQVLLVRQYRRGLDDISCELPAGVIEPGEAPLEAARRELLEETGYRADSWQELLTVATEPARHTARAHFYFARDAWRASELRLDQTEHLEPYTIEVPELLRLVDSGQIAHGLHVAAILLAHRRGLLR